MSWGIPVPDRVPAGGLGWGRALLSGSGVPADALGNLGDRYYDTATGRWYLKRWVGNFDGSDVAIPSSEPPLGSGFIARAVFKTQAAMGSSGLVDIMGRELSFKLRTSASYLSLLLGTGAGWGFNSSTIFNLFDSTWYRVEIDTLTVPGTLKIKLNGTEILNVAHGTAIGPSASGFRIGTVTNPSNIRPTALVEFGGSRWAMGEGFGTTLVDSSGLGRNCTVTDAIPATFWAQTWVPMDLLA